MTNNTNLSDNGEGSRAVRQQYSIQLPDHGGINVSVDVIGHYADNATWRVVERSTGRELGTADTKWAAIDAAIMRLLKTAMKSLN
jgi:hypothetical protein